MRTALLVFVLAAASTAGAQPADWESVMADAVEAGLSTTSSITGQQLHENRNNSLFVSTYVAAVLDMGELDPKLRRYCMPPRATVGQAMDVALKYLEGKPEDRHLGGAFLVRQALRQAWPCPVEPAAPPPSRRPKRQL